LLFFFDGKAIAMANIEENKNLEAPKGIKINPQTSKLIPNSPQTDALFHPWNVLFLT
jgi:hypothetical protein